MTRTSVSATTVVPRGRPLSAGCAWAAAACLAAPAAAGLGSTARKPRRRWLRTAGRLSRVAAVTVFLVACASGFGTARASAAPLMLYPPPGPIFLCNGTAPQQSDPAWVGEVAAGPPASLSGCPAPSYTDVWGTFRIPKITPTDCTNPNPATNSCESQMAIWVGIGGNNNLNGSLTQAGILITYTVTNSPDPGLAQTDFAISPYFQDNTDSSTDNSNHGLQPESFAQPARPGNLIFVHVGLENGNRSVYLVKDESTGQMMSCGGASSTPAGCIHGNINPQASYGTSAEWIVEKPDHAIWQVPDYGAVTFTSAIFATASAPLRPLFVYRSFHQGIYSLSNDPDHQGFIDARPAITSTGTGVSVTQYFPPPVGEGQVSAG